ncbi:Linear gramicidin synthase subunit B [Pseudoalteromonas sp. CIP111854]|uniref:Linear gramicidin synthase subunit B n=1 Tax=Pseudoalteromonas holothuriae TaxID=2963714 RepID=A0A9W4QSN3_9GAMM|nr:non-ribosomal peptide synthetase [Pseudoalteromonas sp. CIP111854]CAH9051201.1 Linear gramicidin synthase subunit B [Pseudoalteromonas sp. CIP111854]
MDAALRLKLAKQLAKVRGLKQSTKGGSESNTVQLTIPVLKNTTLQPSIVSHAQERMWLLHQLDPTSSAFNVCVLWHFEGALDSGAIHSSCIEITKRHNIFRTIYRADATDGAQQQVLDRLEPQWDYIDLSGLPAEEQQQKLHNLAQALSTQAFDLACLSTLKLTLVKQSQTQHTLIMVGQHIVWDGPSFGIFAQELGYFYNQLVQGKEEQREPLPIQYGDFARWHRAKWQSDYDTKQQHLDYWRSVLTPLPEPIDFPTDLPRTGNENEGGGWLTANLTQQATQNLQVFAAELKVTAFEVVVAVIAIFMTRLSRSSEVTIGTVASLRNLPEQESLIGNFGNVVPLRIPVDSTLEFATFVSATAARCRQSFSHADMPFEILLNELKVPRGHKQSPLLDTMLTFLSRGMAAPDMSGVDVSWQKHFNGTTQTDLSFDALLINGQLQFQATWRTSLYHTKTIKSHLQRLLALIEQCVSEPRKVLAHHSICNLADRQQLVWGDRGDAQDNAQQTLVDVFEQTVLKNKDETACELRSINAHLPSSALTFAQLNAQANIIARWLILQNVGPEDSVAISLGRTVDWFIAMLGVLKSGAAFLPIDPAYPQEYRARVVSLAQPKVVICGQADKFDAGGKLEITLASIKCIEHAMQATSNAADDVLQSDRVRPLGVKNIACLIFTSGSTGLPKGVMVPHSSLVNLFNSHKRDLYKPTCLTTNKTQLSVGHAWSFAFDAAWQPTLWLFAGHKVCLFDAQTMQDPLALAESIISQKLDFIELTPSLLEEVLPWLRSGFDSASGQALLPHVPAVLGFGGESVKSSLWQQLAMLDNTLAVNLYGPTEATVDTMIGFVEQNTKPNIGVPVSGAKVYVLDECMQLSPIGIAGELAVSGSGLARGYLNRGDLTAEKFIANPFSSQHERLYLTGDRVRWNDAGKLEFLGRIDEQVKIRGFRVEPLEVESNIEQLIKSPCAVIANEMSTGTHLICFVETASAHVIDEASTIATYKQLCEQALPSHLIPKYFVLATNLPKLPSGKIARKQLEVPKNIEKTTIKKPTTELEITLCQLFCDVLGLENIGVEQGFFDCGGDSISVIKLVSRARNKGIYLSPKLVFDANTVAKIAMALAGRGLTGKTEAVKHDDVLGEVFSTPLMRKYLSTQIPLQRFAQLVSVTVPSGVSVVMLNKLLNHLVAHHSMLRATLVYPQNDTIPYLEITQPPQFKTYCNALYQQADQGQYQLIDRVDSDDTLAQYCNAQQLARALCNQLSPEHGTMLSSFLIESKGTKHKCVWIAVNHLVVDTGSWFVLIEDLATLFEQLSNTQALQLEPTATAWPTWSKSLPNVGLTQQIYQPHKVSTLANTDTISWHIPLYNKGCPVRHIAQQNHLPLASVLPALVMMALQNAQAMTADDDYTLILERHGREAINAKQDLSRTVGWFAKETFVPISVSPCFDKTTRQQVMRQLIAHVSSVIAHDVSLLEQTTVKSEQIANMTSLRVGFNYLGDVLEGSSDDMWRVSPLLDQIKSASGEHWPILNDIDFSAYYAQKEGGKSLCLTAIFTDSLTNTDKLSDFYTSLMALVSLLDERSHNDNNQAIIASSQSMPVTPLQKTMLQQISTHSDPWTSFITLSLSAEQAPWLNEQYLKTNARQLLTQFDVLTTSYNKKTYLCQFHQGLVPDWQSVDLRDFESSDVMHEAQRNVSQWQQFQFDLTNPPLLRFLCLQVSDNAWQVSVHCHHLLLDGWSLPKLLSCWLAPTKQLPAIAQNATWHAYLDWLTKQDFTQSWKYWLKQFKGLKRASLIAPQRLHSSITVDISKTLEGEFSERLNIAAHQAKVSFATLLQLAWAHTVSEVVSYSDVTFGLFDSGRATHFDGIETLTGLVTQCVPLRLDVEQPLNSALAQIESSRYDWQSLLPLDMEVICSQAGFAPVFDTLLVVENALDAQREHAEEHELTQNEYVNYGLAGVDDIQWQDSVGYACALFVYPHKQIKLRLSFDARAVTEHRAEQMVDCFVTKLTAIEASIANGSANKNHTDTISINVTESINE